MSRPGCLTWLTRYESLWHFHRFAYLSFRWILLCVVAWSQHFHEIIQLHAMCCNSYAFHLFPLTGCLLSFMIWLLSRFLGIQKRCRSAWHDLRYTRHPAFQLNSILCTFFPNSQIFRQEWLFELSVKVCGLLTRRVYGFRHFSVLLFCGITTNCV